MEPETTPKIAKIYKISSPETDKIYIGSTTKSLSQRLSQHKRGYKRYINGRFNYVTSFDIVKLNEPVIDLLESFPYESKVKLHEIERYYIELYRDITVNKNIPNRSSKEWFDANPDYLKKYGCVYNKLKSHCQYCNCELTKCNMSHHNKTKKHQTNKLRINQLLEKHELQLRQMNELHNLQLELTV